MKEIFLNKVLEMNSDNEKLKKKIKQLEQEYK
jgi:hypothetical protein